MNRKTILAYSVGVFLCLLILVWAMKLWEADLTVPFAYQGDALPNYVWAKGIIDNGWYLHNRFVGMPTGLDMHDYAQSQNLDFLLLKFISVFTQNYAFTVNIYFLLTFFLTTLTSIFVFRQFNLTYSSSIFGGLLFAFSSFHFLRFVHHLQYASYFMIPLIVMVILWVRSKNSILFSPERSGEKLKFNLFSCKAILSIIICILISSVVIYYAFFSVFFLLVIGLLSSFQQKSWRPLVTSVFLIAVITLGFIANLSPTLIYQHEHGRNLEVAIRGSAEAEVFGLKIIHLFLPVLGHRIPFLANMTSRYENTAPLINENMFASLGLIGSTGFVVLIAVFFYSSFAGVKTKDNLYKLNTLSILNLSAILLATIGGFGSIFAFLISPQIRAYNRISIFIAFFSLFAVVILLDKCSKEFSRFKIIRFLFNGLIGFLLFIGILDQIPKEAHITSYLSIRGYPAIKAEYLNDANFIESIEGLMPKGSMIFQLPYVPFPENPTVNRMLDYDLFRPYLHSKSLKWSYGAMRGRGGDAWQREVTAKSLNEMLETLAYAGFSGIYLDRFAYADSGAELEEKLSNLLDTKPIISTNKRLLFFNTISFNQKLRSRFTNEEWRLKQWSALPLNIQWGGGFSKLEGTPENNWRWCSSKGELSITNPWHQSREVTLEMFFQTDYEEFYKIWIDSPGFSERFQINRKGKYFSKTLTIPPGKYAIQFKSDAKRVNAPWDSRILIFRINNFRFNPN